MIIREKIGTLKNFEVGSREIDWLRLEWFEVNKRIVHKRTEAGREIILKFLRENPQLMQDDIVYVDNQVVVVIDILPYEVIVLHPVSMYQMAALCYEIGNKHLPLFFENEAILVPYEAPLFRQLEASGYKPKQEKRKLWQPLKTSVSPHSHGGSGSLFSRILQRTTPA